MEQSGVRFGTSGARGLVTAMTDQTCAAYTAAFLKTLEERGETSPGASVLIAGDLRPSTGRILSAVAFAIQARGYVVEHAGRVPSPAVALEGLVRAVPSIMVTGSHIPADRNGIKFNKPTGEILKSDEAAIRAQSIELPGDFDASGNLVPGAAPQLPEAESGVAERYVARWLDAFPVNLLGGRHLVVYGHSAVGREMLVAVLEGLGARVTRVGWSETFVPVDTEAVRPLDVSLARSWAAQQRPFAILSTDGDSDRPLLADEAGTWLRGDVLGVLAARYLSADVVVTPVSSNTVAERSQAFDRVVRTRIGSPFVIEAMNRAAANGATRVVGYEANGGVLTATPLSVPGGHALSALPTRDALIGMLSLLAAAVEQRIPLSELVATLPPRFTASERLQDFPTALTQPRLAELERGGPAAVDALLGRGFSPAALVDATDGVRATLENGEIVHLRGSGNAPELRCYAEADSNERAVELASHALQAAERSWR